MIDAIPCPAPNVDPQQLESILAIASGVAQDGKDFEEKTREKESHNPHFSFLFEHNSQAYAYYKWILYCTRMNYSATDRKELEEEHKEYLIRVTPPGCLELTAIDQQDLTMQLRKNDGSKDVIRAVRRWVIERAHSLQHSALVMKQHINELVAEVDAGVIDRHEAYLHSLHTLYAVNDIITNGDEASMLGPYTYVLHQQNHIAVDVINSMLPSLPGMIGGCYQLSGDATQQDKVLSLLRLWTQRGYITEEMSRSLRKQLEERPTLTYGAIEVPELSHSLLVSPYLKKKVSAASSSVDVQNTPTLNPALLSQLQRIQQKLQEQVSSSAPSDHPPPPVPPRLPAGVDSFGGDHSTNIALNQSEPMNSVGPKIIPTVGGPLVVLDLAQIPVGNMANMVRTAKRSGQPLYKPIDFSSMVQTSSPYIEPGRLEARVSEFYKYAEQILLRAAAPGEATMAGTAVAEKSKKKRSAVHAVDDKDKYNIDLDEEEGWEKNVPGYEEEKYSNEQFRNSSFSYSTRKYARLGNDSRLRAGAQSGEAFESISEDNMGHKLLRGLGWQEGKGLGADGGGIVEPVRGDRSGKTMRDDKSGVGAGDSIRPGDSAEAYRLQMSTEYHRSR